MDNQSLPNPVNILLLMDPVPGRTAGLEAIAPGRIKVREIPAQAVACDGGGIWPARSNTALSEAGTTREERDRTLAEAHVIYLGFPYPTRVYERAKNAFWFHHPAAGVSNLRSSDVWEQPVMVTSGRGSNAALPIAEIAFAGALMLAKGLHLAARGSLERAPYGKNLTIRGKTMGIVGLGGIGSEIARLARGAGMRVIATRRSVTQRQEDVPGIDELYPASEMHAMLAESDFVAVCAMLTRETERMLDARAFDAMKTGAILVNIARGEIVDEPAMIAALDSGKLRGAYLDVYAGEHDDGPPRPELASNPNVVITPHIAMAADASGPRGWDVFVENLHLLVEGKPLRNVVDWERGY